MKHEQAPIKDFCTREEFEADPARVLDAAIQAPVVVKAPNGRFTIEFVLGEKRSVGEWATSPGQLEDGDSF
ncbi:hypothetical protein [Allorhizobium taibaishanense]|uniref:Uncharacterized protein n=1 Tax=Allorhizobium taibaishanense TaxID=887144 RepID=A0A1Q9A317_9HYPH|nr:hypothetical protein [Allorhizobium taibaishanense]MBB4005779.1 hypothetical protein [Allorhizobium taibaishanense]OLP48827.1 hypothetical protein BJF91_16975 [Allorhizobium taibaishanense]